MAAEVRSFVILIPLHLTFFFCRLRFQQLVRLSLFLLSLASSPASARRCLAVDMASSSTDTLAPVLVKSVYIPSAVLIAGTAALKVQWLPVAVAAAAVWGGFQFWQNRTSPRRTSLCEKSTDCPP